MDYIVKWYKEATHKQKMKDIKESIEKQNKGINAFCKKWNTKK